MPIRKIMVPLDGSRFAEQALEYAAQAAWQRQSALDLVRVNLPSALSINQLTGSGLALDLYPDESEYLRTRAQGLRSVGLDARVSVLTGPVAHSLAEHSADSAADLVIMSTHGRSRIRRALLGSVAEELVRIASVPVLLLRPRRSAAEDEGIPYLLDRLLVPIDGSEHSDQILRSVHQLVAGTRASITLLHVLQPPLESAVSISQMHDLARLFRLNGHSVEIRISRGRNVPDTIAEQAADCGAHLIAMSTRALGTVGRFALGSVAAEVARLTQVPLLLRRQTRKEEPHTSVRTTARSFKEPPTEPVSAVR